MHEALWVLAILVVVAGYAAAALVPAHELIVMGQSVMLTSAAIGVPLELLYFAALALCLRANDALPAGWYWRSFLHHHLLTRRQRLWVLPPFYLGALAFVGIALGIGGVLLGFAAAFSQS